MREQYDFSAGVRGKYVERFAEDANIVAHDGKDAFQLTLGELVARFSF